jgi:hypothetical protein
MMAMLTEWEPNWFPGQTWQDREKAYREHWLAEGIDPDVDDSVSIYVNRQLSDEEFANLLDELSKMPRPTSPIGKRN